MTVRTFPLSSADFWQLLPIAELSFDLGEALELSRTGGGQQLSADLGERLWQGRVTLGRMTYGEQQAIEPLIEILRQAGRSFMAHDVRLPAPRLDPTGAILGGASVVLSAVSVDRREVQLSGAPAGYTLRAGDYLAFSYGSSPVRFALHRLVETVVADGSGAFAAAEVTPVVRAGTSFPTPVTLIRPSIKAVLVPGSFSPAVSRRGISEGLGFSFVQSLR